MGVSRELLPQQLLITQRKLGEFSKQNMLVPGEIHSFKEGLEKVCTNGWI